MIKNVFDIKDSKDFIERINNLSKDSQPKWGLMSVGQMLAHCNVTYEMVYEDKHPRATGFKKFILKLLIKPLVVSEKPYKNNSRTAPQFLITTEKDFEIEKNRLISYIEKTQKLGGASFEGKDSNSFGELTQLEWNNMFSKHLNHHLNQFGV